MSVKDVTLAAAALLAFPLTLHLTAWGSSGEGRPVHDPLWQRGGGQPVQTAGR